MATNRKRRSVLVLGRCPSVICACTYADDHAHAIILRARRKQQLPFAFDGDHSEVWICHVSNCPAPIRPSLPAPSVLSWSLAWDAYSRKVPDHPWPRGHVSPSAARYVQYVRDSGERTSPVPDPSMLAHSASSPALISPHLHTWSSIRMYAIILRSLRFLPRLNWPPAHLPGVPSFEEYCGSRMSRLQEDVKPAPLIHVHVVITGRPANDRGLHMATLNRDTSVHADKCPTDQVVPSSAMLLRHDACRNMNIPRGLRAPHSGTSWSIVVRT